MTNAVFKADDNGSEIDKTYRLGVGILLLNKDKDKVFVGKRLDAKRDQKYNAGKAWQMPQGGIETGEIPSIAALRELREETGAKNINVLAESQDWFYYHLPTELAKRLWSGKYVGQAQKWYVMQHLGEDTDFDLKTDVQEFSDWRWVDIAELPDLAVDFKKEMYQQIVTWAMKYAS